MPCGTQRCDPSTQYCVEHISGITPVPTATPTAAVPPVAARIAIVSPIPVTDSGITILPRPDGGTTITNFECLPLPACDASDECTCIDPTMTCRCSKSNGGYFDNCAFLTPL
jgi:hypothetical protein